MNKYQKTAIEVQKKIISDLKKVYNSTNNILELKINDINPLESKYNCISSSTAIGYLLEEYIVRSLVEIDPDFYRRTMESTQQSSYDLLVIKNNISILINLKAEKKNNNAIAAISRLIKDYIDNETDKRDKLYLVLKTKYSINNHSINVTGLKSFYLGQVHFEHLSSDSRNWSKEFNSNSGRMQYNITKGLKDLDTISYKNTIKSIQEWIYNRGKK